MVSKNSISTIILFFILALGWSCGIWIILIPSIQKILHLSLSPMWAWLGLIGPGLSAIFTSFTENKWVEVKNLFTPLFRWRTSIVYYLFVYVGVFVFYAIASWLSGHVYDNQSSKSFIALFESVKAPFFNLHGIWMVLEITIIYTFCEELGWRGYALPKLNNHLSGLSAALILGVFWTLWHIPLIYLYGSSLDVSSAIIYFFHIEAFSIIYAWLYFKTGRSLLMAGLLHGTTDGFWGFFPLINSAVGQGPNLLTVILEVLIALLMGSYLYKVKKLDR